MVFEAETRGQKVVSR
jgi:hypothetical protein